MLRFEGEVFLLGTAIAAPALQLTKKLATNPRLSSTGVSCKGKSRGGGRIVAKARPIAVWLAVASAGTRCEEAMN
jgi:hypothetical protein